MTAERPAVAGGPRPLLLVLLAMAVVAFFALRTNAPMGSARPPGTGPAQRAAIDATIDPAALEVHLEALDGQRPAPADGARNPFAFAARPAAQAQEAFQGPPQDIMPRGNGLPPVAAVPAAKPITVRFIGRVEAPRGGTLAVFVDCSSGRRTPYAREGEIVDGRYRLVAIGLESVVIEHLDGTGRTTLAQSGQECVR